MKYTQIFDNIVKEQLERIERIKTVDVAVDYEKAEQIVIGIIGGDGIGPEITAHAGRVLETLLEDDVKGGRIRFRTINGCTIENRAKAGKAIPDEVLAEIKQCDVLLKGPTTTPRKGDKWANVESANVAMRKELDLFANVRPVKIPELGVDWTFFRENTECLYAMGSQGINITDELAIDFRVITTPGTKRIAKLAYEFAEKNEKKKVTIVTKANVVKATDGKFLEVCKEVSKAYPQIETDDWYIDIMTAKLLDEKRRSQFEVMILPNIYGDILTDEAAELQGGVGTAGSANLGTRYAMFEAIHGSAPRMVEEGRAAYADPSSVIKAGAMLLSHIGYQEYADKLNKAIERSAMPDSGIKITGRSDGATGKELADYILDEVRRCCNG